MVMTKEENKATSSVITISQNWKKNEEAITSDDVIDAYIKGREDGRTEIERVLLQQFESNLKFAKSLAEKLLAESSKRGLAIRSIHLKADSLTSFTALFVANKEDFLKEEFLDLYNISSQFKTENESETFYISFSFLPDMGSLNSERLISDGFFTRYEEKS